MEINDNRRKNSGVIVACWRCMLVILTRGGRGRRLRRIPRRGKSCCIMWVFRGGRRRRWISRTSPYLTSLFQHLVNSIHICWRGRIFFFFFSIIRFFDDIIYEWAKIFARIWNLLKKSWNIGLLFSLIWRESFHSFSQLFCHYNIAMACKLISVYVNLLYRLVSTEGMQFKFNNYQLTRYSNLGC